MKKRSPSPTCYLTSDSDDNPGGAKVSFLVGRRVFTEAKVKELIKHGCCCCSSDLDLKGFNTEWFIDSTDNAWCIPCAVDNEIKN